MSFLAGCLGSIFHIIFLGFPLGPIISQLSDSRVYLKLNSRICSYPTSNIYFLRLLLPSAPMIDPSRLENVLPACLYSPTYVVKDFPIARYQGLQFVSHLKHHLPAGSQKKKHPLRVCDDAYVCVRVRLVTLSTKVVSKMHYKHTDQTINCT